jgi:hypothetical protein
MPSCRELSRDSQSISTICADDIIIIMGLGNHTMPDQRVVSCIRRLTPVFDGLTTAILLYGSQACSYHESHGWLLRVYKGEQLPSNRTKITHHNNTPDRRLNNHTSLPHPFHFQKKLLQTRTSPQR